MSAILGEPIYARVKFSCNQKKSFIAYPVKKTSSITVHHTLKDACFCIKKMASKTLGRNDMDPFP